MFHTATKLLQVSCVPLNNYEEYFLHVRMTPLNMKENANGLSNAFPDL